MLTLVESDELAEQSESDHDGDFAFGHGFDEDIVHDVAEGVWVLLHVFHEDFEHFLVASGGEDDLVDEAFEE